MLGCITRRIRRQQPSPAADARFGYKGERNVTNISLPFVTPPMKDSSLEDSFRMTKHINIRDVMYE
jgi:hypothetical protein